MILSWSNSVLPQERVVGMKGWRGRKEKKPYQERNNRDELLNR